MLDALGVAGEIGLEEAISRAIRTLQVLPDPERRFRCVAGAWPPYVRDFMDAYGSCESGEPVFRPTPRDVSIYLDVLSWLRGLDGIALQILLWRAVGLSLRSIGDEMGVSREAVRLRYVDAVDQVRLAAHAAQAERRAGAA